MKIIKYIMGAIVLISTVTLTVMGYAKLPDKVEKNTEEIQEVKKESEKFASDVRTYIAVQEQRDKSQEETQKLLIELIKAQNAK